MASYICKADTGERRVCGRIKVSEGSEGIARSPDGKWQYAMSHMGSPLPDKGRPPGLSFYVMDTTTDAAVQRVVSAFEWNAV